MLSANLKPKRTAAASRDFLAIARLSCITENIAASREHRANESVLNGLNAETELKAKVALSNYSVLCFRNVAMAAGQLLHCVGRVYRPNATLQ